jgi:ABC-type molybdate transport system permease subunit
MRRPPRRRRLLLRFWLACAVLVAVFAAGIAVGEAINDRPAPGRTQTSVRTLNPLALPPAPVTVTVTVRR